MNNSNSRYIFTVALRKDSVDSINLIFYQSEGSLKFHYHSLSEFTVFKISELTQRFLMEIQPKRTGSLNKLVWLMRNMGK